MRPAALATTTLALLFACTTRTPQPAPPPEAPAPSEPTAPDAGETKAKASTAATPAGEPTAAELQGLDRYAGFSKDGLLFAYAEMSAGAGLPVVSFLSSTTNTVEKTVPLTGETARRALLAELDAEGFARPGATPKIPDEVKASLRDGQVVVTFGPAPAAKPWKPFEALPGTTPQSAEVAAVSPDGERIAVRVSGTGGGEFGPPVEYRVVKLFE